MAELSTPDIKQEVKKHLVIYGFLLFLTAINFIVSKLSLLGEYTVVIVLTVALAQGVLIVCYFMHLISEKKLIHFVLILTVIFFLGLLLLPVMQFWGRLFGSVCVS